MSMQPQHTFLLHDLRPTKDAMHSVLDRVIRSDLSLNDAMQELKALAESIPDLNADEYMTHQRKLLASHNVDRARRLIDCLNDRTIKPWARLTFKLGLLGLKWAVILGAVYAVVRLAVS